MVISGRWEKREHLRWSWCVWYTALSGCAERRTDTACWQTPATRQSPFCNTQEKMLYFGGKKQTNSPFPPQKKPTHYYHIQQQKKGNTQLIHAQNCWTPFSQNQQKYAQHYGRCHHVEYRGSPLNGVWKNTSIKASATSMCVLNSSLKGMLSHQEHFAHYSVHVNNKS